jgi:hypothetical protein
MVNWVFDDSGNTGEWSVRDVFKTALGIVVEGCKKR